MASSSNSKNEVMIVSDAQSVNQVASKAVVGKIANPANELAVIHLQSLMKRLSDKLGSTEEGARGHRLLLLYAP